MNENNKSVFPSYYEEFIYKSRYSRWNDELGRRENWEETVQRYLSFIKKHLENNFKYVIKDDLYNELFEYIYTLKVMPSMRALMTAGPALERDNSCGYNCSYLPIDDIKAFDEAMYLLMCGCGVGFSVERQYVNKLPEIPEKLFDSETTIFVKDSKESWAKSLRQLISLLYSGEIPKWDLSRIRPKGSKLKTFGGRASGPEPLNSLFDFICKKFKSACGRKLTSIEVHDIMCKIAEIVISGGVRRSAMISLSNLSDDRMRKAKSGNWVEHESQRALSNNSVCYTERPDIGIFIEEWLSLYESKSGERGIFNRNSCKKTIERNNRRDPNWDWGTNPCSEIILRPNQFCNLTEIVVRNTDNLETLKNKARVASILGTIQSTLTFFPYLRRIWQKNCEEERLLGVSLTGLFDNEFFTKKTEKLKNVLLELKKEVIETNEKFAKELGINPSSATTCIKPSGTVSQLVNSSSGIHPRYSKYYLRLVRIDNKDPIRQFLIDSGIPFEPCVIKPDDLTVFYFPITQDGSSVYRNDFSAIEQLELWKLYSLYWCEHKPSITIYVREDEWLEVGAWVYKNFDFVSGVSFLPYTDHIYKQAPYIEISKEEFENFKNKMPKEISWNNLNKYEKEDFTVGSQSLACSGDSCEIVDLIR